MALTVKNVNTLSEDTFGRHRVRFVDVTFDTSYDAGGESLTPGSVALAEIVGATILGNNSGFLVAFDATARKLKVFNTLAAHTHVENTAAAYTQNAVTGAATAAAAGEVAAATDLSSVTVRLLVLGS